MGPAPVFICGIARSGTTLLLRLLDAHPALAVLPGEPSLYRSLGRGPLRVALRIAGYTDSAALLGFFGRQSLARVAFRGRRDLGDRLRSWVRNVGTPDDLEGSVVKAMRETDGPKTYWNPFLEIYQEMVGEGLANKRYWVEKTPLNEEFTPLSERWFRSRCRHLHLVRDPRDVFASWIVRTTLSGADRTKAIVRLIFAWSRSVQLCRTHLTTYPGRYHPVRYEDLVTRPQAVMAMLCELLGVPMDPSALSATRLGVPMPSNTSYPLPNSQTGTVQSSIGRYRDTLAEAEVDLIQRLLRHQMLACGYRPTPLLRRNPLWHNIGWNPTMALKALTVARRELKVRNALLPVVGAA